MILEIQAEERGCLCVLMQELQVLIRNGALGWRMGWEAFQKERTAPAEAMGGRSRTRSTTQCGSEREHGEG